MSETLSGRGGKRPGAGRPATGRTTKVIRVPDYLVDEVKRLIEGKGEINSENISQGRQITKDEIIDAINTAIRSKKKLKVSLIILVKKLFPETDINEADL
jgi:hypothetical protein